MIRNILLICGMAAVWTVVYYFLKKTDLFLEENRKAVDREKETKQGMDQLRIAFSDPFSAESFSEILERLSEHHPDLELCLYAGEEKTILEYLEKERLDIAVVSEENQIQPEDGMEELRVRLKQKKDTEGGLRPLVPPEQKKLSKKIVWKRNAASHMAEEFAREAESCFSQTVEENEEMW